RGRRL
ncbi:hypothetical protein BN1723_020552, partial [Verticillium longisporum]